MDEVVYKLRMKAALVELEDNALQFGLVEEFALQAQAAHENGEMAGNWREAALQFAEDMVRYAKDRGGSHNPHVARLVSNVVEIINDDMLWEYAVRAPDPAWEEYAAGEQSA